MRADLAVLAISASLLVTGSFANTASADAPNLDLYARGNSAVANYKLTPRTHMTVGAAELVSLTGEKRYFAFVAMDEEPACLPDCLLPNLPLLGASSEFDSPQLRGGVNGSRLDVTLPVIYCALASCPASIEVSLDWEPDGQPTRDTSSTRTVTESCQFTRVTRFAYTTATATGFVSDGTTTLASGEASGSLLQQSSRIVGFGDPGVCL